MKMWENLKTNYLINLKGQAILELATFGSVVLFCLALLVHFGLQMNYQQNVQMQAFRKSLKLAYYKQGPNAQASLTMLKDKPAVDPRDKWGFADRVSVGGGATVTWGNTLNEIYTTSIDEKDVSDQDLPRLYIDVNQGQSGGMGLANSEINNNLDKDKIGYSFPIYNGALVKDNTKGVFTIAKPRTVSRLQDPNIYKEIGTYIDNSTHDQPDCCDTTKYPGCDKKDYCAKELNLQTDIKVFEDAQDPLIHYATYMQNNGLQRTLDNVVFISPDTVDPSTGKISNSSLDNFLNGTARQYSLIAVKGSFQSEQGNGSHPTNECDSDLYCGVLTDILVMDPRQGEIDTYYADIKPEDKNNPYQPKTLADKQGLLMDSKKVMDYASGTKLTTTETATGISTKTESATTQTVTHKVKLNKASGLPVVDVEIPVTFTPDPVKQGYNYNVKHE
jgi:hypothetical protein